MNKTRQIILERLNIKEAKEKVVEPAKPQTAFEKNYEKLIARIESKSVSIRSRLYKKLLAEIIPVVSSAGSNKNKLNVLTRNFLQDFNKHVKGE